jgi:hypothetical protein
VSARAAFDAVFVTALVAACSGNGPPRPTDAAPFPMPNSPSSGLPHPQNYSVNEADGLVLDEVTGLEWQRSVDVGPGESGGFVWEAAVAHCDELEQGGKSDFYLPSRLELVTLVDPARFDPAIDGDAFPETAPEAYWTASPVAASAEQSFYVNLFFGYTSSNYRVYEQFVRCVRNAEQPELPTTDRFRIEGGTVLDRMTGLRWERSPSVAAGKLDEAKTYCSALVVDGDGSFRMPSMKELQTIVDETRAGVTIDLDVFPDAHADGYWSSTRDAQNASSAWVARFSDGYTLSADEDEPFFVRCVH